MVSRKQAIIHNNNVVSSVTAVLMESRIVDPFRFLTDQDYSVRMIKKYIDAANVARKVMKLPNLFLYDLSKID